MGRSADFQTTGVELEWIAGDNVSLDPEDQITRGDLVLETGAEVGALRGDEVSSNARPAFDIGIGREVSPYDDVVFGERGEVLGGSVATNADHCESSSERGEHETSTFWGEW